MQTNLYKNSLALLFFFTAISLQAHANNLDIYTTPQKAPKSYWMNEKGNLLSLNQMKGRFIIINFWSTNCGPCLKEMPSLDALQKKYQSAGLNVLTISVDENDSVTKIQEYYQRLNIKNLPIYTDPTKTTARNWGISLLPTTYILNPKGYIIALKEGYMDWMNSSFQKQLKKWLAESYTPQPPSTDRPIIKDKYFIQRIGVGD